MPTSDTQPPDIQCDSQHAALAVRDIPEAVEYYTEKLGFRKIFTWGEPPTFAGISFGNVQMFLNKGTPTPSPETASVFFDVEDVDSIFEFHRANGVQIPQPIADRPWGMRDYLVRDLFGYGLVFGQPLFRGHDIPIKRVDVPIRLESRLAALLHDLAEHKRMSLSSCLEEILLHTNDGAGPHTKMTLRYIAALKKKHAIDYDTHASYSFVEE
jgi:uncharacterized glyoxalase superfamily protein PhnB